MRLVDLAPVWIMRDGRRIGFTFISPKQRVRSDGTVTRPPVRQSCFLDSPPMDEQLRLFVATHGGLEGDDELAREMVQSCSLGCGWSIWSSPNGDQDHPNIEAADFATLSCWPSLNGEKGGLWHGHITDGEIVGGI